MDKVLGRLLIAGLCVAGVAAAAAPVVAKPPPAGVWERYHFKDAKGRIHTIVDQMQIPRADYAATECSAIAKRVTEGFIKSEVAMHPEVAGMTFVNADCATDKSGKIKIAVGAWPAGSN